MPEPIGDATMSALHYALSGLALRQRTIADNTANIETPGFLAGRVSFEDTLRSSIADGSDPFASAPVIFGLSKPKLTAFASDRLSLAALVISRPKRTESVLQ